jgi:chorismate synthase
MDGRFTIRPLETLEEFLACHALQQAAWGFSELLVIPYTQLMTVQRNGGIVLGAFDDDKLIGLVYGFLARQGNGPLYLFSQRLCLLPAYQGQGIGEQLKWAQRKWALRGGLDHILWTYDPLQPANAHLNIAKLGGIAREYRRDHYGTHEALHGPLPTDRLLVDWDLLSDRVTGRLFRERPTSTDLYPELLVHAGPPVNPVAWDLRGWPTSGEPDLARTTPLLRIEVPGEWNRLLAADTALALDWRARTRALFEHYLGRGYVVTGYVRGKPLGLINNYYLLEALA